MLNALSGRAPYAEVTGSVQLGSASLTKSHLNYVPQFDLLNPSMTISRTLCIMAKLTNTDVDCATRVVELLHILGLASRAEELVGSLSSGDRKRVSIGLGLISNPAVLFLDEPTTGLDSEAALVVVDYCVKVARATGVVCVMTLHQPSAAIFAKLDNLLLLSRGKLAYAGPTSVAQTYFEQQGFHVPQQTNPADFFLDLMNAKTLGDVDLEHKEQQGESHVCAKPVPNWRQQFDESSFGQYEDSKIPKGGCVSADAERPSELERLSVLIRSRVLYFWLERSIYLHRLVQMILLAIFIGTLFLDLARSVLKLNELAGAMFFNVWVVLFAAIGATPIFVRDRAIVENEYLNGAYEFGTHVLALFLAALPYHLLTAIIYQSIVWFLVGFHDAFEPWLFAVLSTLSLLLLMEAISLLVVEFIPNAMLATTGTMVVLGTFFLFPGFFVKVPDMVRSMAWLSWVVPTKYSLDSQIRNIFDGQTYDDGRGGYISGEDINRDFFELHNRNKWGDWTAVMAYAFGFRILHYMALRWHYRMYSKGELTGSNH
jgi:ABC-type multidrug transport system ATPase subunit